MKLTKRMKNAILQGFIGNVIFLLILLGVLLFSIFPRIQEIEVEKSTLQENFNSFQDIRQNGISYSDLRQSLTKTGKTQDSYVRNLLRNITESFYSQSFTNTGSLSYAEFLDDLENSILDFKASDAYKQKDKTLNLVLPVYSGESEYSQEGLSDFYFTNYIENTLYDFNLESRGDIGIGAIEEVDKTESSDEQKNDLQEDIFAISLELDITGRKSDIVNFIHFFENVGSVNISGDKLSIYNDSFIQGVPSDIYENQVADIVSLKMPTYPDSSPLPSKKGLISVMKEEQSSEKTSVEVILNFYVAGVPGYKMEQYILDFLSSYEQLSSDVSKNAKKYLAQAFKFEKGEQLQAISQIQSLEALLLSFDDDIKRLRGKVAKRENIQGIYRDVIIKSKQLERIEKSYLQQISLLEEI